MEYYVKSVIPIIESNYDKFTAVEKVGADFYMIPRSLHECIIISDEGTVNDLLKYINANPLEGEDQLSDNGYHYDFVKHRFDYYVSK